jgi:hypothetical protein
MTKPTIRIHNTATDEVIDREMTDAEFADYQANQELQASRKAEAEAKTAKRATAEAKLAALGLTTDDLKALGLGGN